MLSPLTILLLPCLALASSLSHTHLHSSHTPKSNACTSKKFQNYLTLSSYPPAQSYCTKHYPPSTTTLTSTHVVSVGVHSTTAKGTHRVGSGAAPSRNRFIPAAAPNERARGQDWQSAQESGKGFVRELCGCIEKGVTKTHTVTVTTSGTAAGGEGTTTTAKVGGSTTSATTSEMSSAA